MSVGVESTLRGPNAYDLARKVLEDMERRHIWPTALNYELWTHYVANPDGALAQEIERLLSIGEAITEGVSEQLAAAYLPKARLNEQIRDAGDQLTRELTAVAAAIKQAQRSSEQYGATLTSAGKSLDEDVGPEDIRRLVDTLTTATKRVQRENRSLAKRLDESTAEVSRLREHLEQVRRDATTDALTNLANRKAFDDELARACAEAVEKREPLALAVIDIDHFKRFNDTWGHQTGDQVIRYVSSVIGRMAPPPRFAARYGGEEFAMIFPSERAAEVVRTLEEIREEVSSRALKRRSTNEDLGTITVSAGVAELKHGEKVDVLIERADQALYASKRNGRNQVTTDSGVAAAA
ncbi:GGDEF domain-containing protein [Phenylobacterium montanum]|uniref:diguanylate cyclase n=1 Tax=Phenylobacterium montanum TaxID=2823693 RepID=A0A975FZR5_9CAUL|nr:GGDEF domain-containing protein [Caulobacter sp. S6]QUD88161.1 GGDEF domain-containing protein [Caulobacter sp. S6]